MNSESPPLLIGVNNLTVRWGDKVILSNISFDLDQQDHIVIVGNAGSGKSTLAKALAQKIFYEGEINFYFGKKPNIVLIEQQHGIKNKVNTTDLYYQQRFNSIDAEDSITVKEYLNDSIFTASFIHELNLHYILDRPLIQLSNGENKKVQLAKYLSTNPDILILDNPFLGLDLNTRRFLHNYLHQLSKNGITCIVITSPDEIPTFVTKILVLDSGKLLFYEVRQHYIQRLKNSPFVIFKTNRSIPVNHINAYSDFEYAVKMEDIKVKYGETKLLDGINWEIKRGDRWHLKGHNGAGKSTLLSLITGDNPQAYANEIYLFDKKRGTGESIWDIKNKIGYISPEVHQYYDKTTTVFNAIGSGFFDSMGLFQKLSTTHKKIVEDWIQFLEFEDIKDKYLYEISLGLQRMALLARAFIKNPPLLILDEPCQGLDQNQKQEVLKTIDDVCLDLNKTLIYVSHYDDEKPDCVSRIMLLKDGKMKMIE